jgi:drug/metabolite transporter (DMT)-like permease
VPSALAALLVATVPLWMIVLDAVFGGQRPSWRATAGTLIGFLGVILLIGTPPAAATVMASYGAAALILASLFWAMGSLFSRGAKLPPSQLLGTAMEMLSGGIALLLLSFMVAEWKDFDPAADSGRSLLARAYLTVIGAAAFVVILPWGLRKTQSPSRFSVFALNL